jgi:hypothetical protein
MRRLLTIGTMLCVLGGLQAQESEQVQDVSCQATLSAAENDFVAGKFYGIPSLLQGCIDRNAFSKEEQFRVYMLLTQAYLLSDDPASAEDSYLLLLQADPEFVADAAADPIDVVYLSKKFTTTPIFTPHFKIGPNLTGQKIIHHNGVSGTNVVRDYTPQVGVTMGAGIEWNINDNFGLGGEALFSYKTFRSSIDKIYGRDYLASTERQLWFDVPLYLRYGHHLGKIRPYGYAGYAANFLVFDRLQLDFTNYTQGTAEETEVQGANLGVMYKRYIVSGSLVFGGGVKYKWGKNFLLFDLRYMAGLNNIVNTQTNHYDSKETFALDPGLPRYSNIGDTYRVNNLSMTIGFVRPLYDPRRLTKVKTKGVSKEISGE